MKNLESIRIADPPTSQTIQKQLDDFDAAVAPMAKWLKANYHPNARVVVEWNRAYVLEEGIGVPYSSLGLK